MKKYNTFCIRPLIALTFCLMVFYQVPANAQTLNNEFRKGVLPNQMFDTRSLSMANTTIADLYGWTSIGVNPALTGLFANPLFLQFNSNYNWNTNLMQHNLSLPTMTVGSQHFTTRFGIIHPEFENMPYKDNSSLPPPDITLYRAEVAYAIALSSYFSIGTLQSLSYTTSNEEAHYWNYFADVGLIYAPDGTISYALVLRGLGNETTYEIIETGLTTLGTRMARQILEIGATFRYPVEETTYLSISFANEKRFGEEGLWYKGGVELIPDSAVKIRGGIMVNFDQSEYVPRFGFGFNTGGFMLDYMIAPNNLTGEQFHQVGLTIQL